MSFQDAVQKVSKVKSRVNVFVDTSKKEEEKKKEEEEEKKPAIKPRSFQKMVKKVVHTQATIGVVDKRKHVLYPSNSKTCLQENKVEGGTPITPEKAKKLRAKVFGSSSMVGPVESEWIYQSFCFQQNDTPMAYGLRVIKNVTRGLVMCVQGFVLKHLLFSKPKSLKSNSEPKTLIKASMRQQEDALVDALSDIVWQAGDKANAVLCLSQENAYVSDDESFQCDGCTEKENAYVSDDESFQCDGCTEKIHIFEFEKYDELKLTIKRHLFEFMSNSRSGFLLFIYSLILTRTFKKVDEDMDDMRESLIQTSGHIHPFLAAFILTGRPTPYLHNGIRYEGSEETMAKPKTGVLRRAEVGHLVWQRPECRLQVSVGSRLKTPTLPIWVVRSDDSYGVLFNPNRELLRDYHAENRFDLYYYSSANNHTKSTVVTIDTRTQDTKDEFNTPVLENIIHTKWSDAEVTWNGCNPYI